MIVVDFKSDLLGVHFLSQIPHILKSFLLHLELKFNILIFGFARAAEENAAEEGPKESDDDTRYPTHDKCTFFRAEETTSSHYITHRQLFTNWSLLWHILSYWEINLFTLPQLLDRQILYIFLEVRLKPVKFENVSGVNINFFPLDHGNVTLLPRGNRRVLVLPFRNALKHVHHLQNVRK